MVRQVKDPEAGRTTSGASTSSSPPRPPLLEKKESQTNTLRIVPSTPPQFLSTTQSPTRDPIYGRTALPTSIHHLLAAPGKEQNLQGSALEDEVSKSPIPTTSNGSTSSLETTHQPQSSRYGTTATGSPVARPLPKKKLQVNLNPGGKTFNVSLASTSRRSNDDDGNASTKSPTPANSLSTKSSYDFLSSPDIQEIQPKQSNSALSCTPDAFPPSSAAPANEQSAPSSEPVPADPISSSPWNYRLVGGLRKVPKTPDLKQKAVGITDSPLPPLPETSDDPQQPAHDLPSLASKPSFATTESDNTNYKVYQHSPSPSRTAEVLPSSSDSNYRVIGEPSPTPSSVIHRPLTSDTNENYVVYGDPSAEPSPSTSFVNLVRPAEYSQESLIVPPLKPRAGKTNEGFGYYKSRSRESLRTGSLTSISTVLSQKEALRAIAASGALINHPGRSNSNSSSSWASSSGNPYTQHMNEHPHQWSSQLSTIGSVSEEGTDRNSRQWSEGNGRRVSSGFPSSNSRHSRQMLSISSSLAQEEERLSRSRSESLEPPQPAYARNGRSMSNPSLRLVGDQDEHGDGITDMQELRSRPSRNRLSGFFSGSSSNDGRTNTMRSTLSTASSRANSLVSSSLPAWAKIYYGSGERKLLIAPRGSISSSDDSRNNSFRSGSPSDHFPLSIYSPRRRPHEENNAPQPREARRRASLEITPIQPTYNGRRPFRTSSVWSPHLRTDLRTRHSVWDAPSLNFSTESGIFGKRNSQVVLFIMGFIFPFAWMIAAFLPLPPDPMLSMRERDRSSVNLDVSNDYALQFGPADEKRYESARLVAAAESMHECDGNSHYCCDYRSCRYRRQRELVK